MFDTFQRGIALQSTAHCDPNYVLQFCRYLAKDYVWSSQHFRDHCKYSFYQARKNFHWSCRGFRHCPRVSRSRFWSVVCQTIDSRPQTWISNGDRKNSRVRWQGGMEGWSSSCGVEPTKNWAPRTCSTLNSHWWNSFPCCGQIFR